MEQPKVKGGCVKCVNCMQKLGKRDRNRNQLLDFEKSKFQFTEEFCSQRNLDFGHVQISSDEALDVVFSNSKSSIHCDKKVMCEACVDLFTPLFQLYVRFLSISSDESFVKKSWEHPSRVHRDLTALLNELNIFKTESEDDDELDDIGFQDDPLSLETETMIQVQVQTTSKTSLPDISSRTETPAATPKVVVQSEPGVRTSTRRCLLGNENLCVEDESDEVGRIRIIGFLEVQSTRKTEKSTEEVQAPRKPRRPCILRTHTDTVRGEDKSKSTIRNISSDSLLGKGRISEGKSGQLNVASLVPTSAAVSPSRETWETFNSDVKPELTQSTVRSRCSRKQKLVTKSDLPEVDSTIPVSNSILNSDSSESAQISAPNSTDNSSHKTSTLSPESESKVDLIPCPKCCEKFPTNSSLQKHLYGHCDGKRSYCHLCYCGFSSQRTHSKHMHKEHPDAISPSFGPSVKYRDLRCQLCQNKYLVQVTLVKHIAKVHSRCHFCQVEFPTCDEIMEHIKTAHPPVRGKSEQQLICEHCGFTATDRTKMSAHRLYYHPRVPKPIHNCPHCSKKFTNRFLFNRHLILHSNEEIFKCDQCSTAFTFRKSLDEHKRMHKGETTCKSCGFVASSPRSLSQHVKHVHEGVKRKRKKRTRTTASAIASGPAKKINLENVEGGNSSVQIVQDTATADQS